MILKKNLLCNTDIYSRAKANTTESPGNMNDGVNGWGDKPQKVYLFIYFKPDFLIIFSLKMSIVEITVYI